MDSEVLREALAGHAGGVVVVAARAGDGFRGLTATSFISVALDPPIVAMALDRFAATRDAVLSERTFGVSVLESRQKFVADRFAGRAPLVDPAWTSVSHWIGAGGAPLIEGCVAWFECSVETTYASGDHDLVVARVSAAGRGEGEPLVLWDREFWRLA